MRRLKNLKIKSIGIVDKGASGDSKNRPRIVLMKRLEKGWQGNLEDTIKFLIAEGYDKDQAVAIAYDLGKDHGLNKEAVSKKQQTKGSGMTIKDFISKALGLPIAKEDPEAMLEAAMAGIPEEAKQKILEAVAMLMKQKPADPKPEDEAMKKEVEVQKKLVEDKDKTIVELQKKLDDEMVAKKLSEVTQIVKETPCVPGEEKERIERLMKIRSLGDSEFEAEVKSIRASNEVIKKSLEGQKGTSRDAGANGIDALSKLQTIAKSYIEEAIKKGEKLGDGSAFKRACDLNPELFAESMKG